MFTSKKAKKRNYYRSSQGKGHDQWLKSNGERKICLELERTKRKEGTILKAYSFESHENREKVKYPNHDLKIL